MNDILVFGANGLLGSHLCALYPNQTIPVTREECDITNGEQIVHVLTEYKPKVVINCAGLTNKASNDPESMYQVNSLSPHRIEAVCDSFRMRLIHVSTDCVFGKNARWATEDEPPTPDDEYGRSKLRGEINRFPHLTIRTSFVGWPDYKGYGLLSWLYRQPNPVPAWRFAWWNGLTTVRLARYLIETAHEPVYGIRHVFGESINKYYLMKTVSQIYGWEKEFEVLDDPKITRILASNYGNQLDPFFIDQVIEMAEKEDQLLGWAGI